MAVVKFTSYTSIILFSFSLVLKKLSSLNFSLLKKNQDFYVFRTSKIPGNMLDDEKTVSAFAHFVHMIKDVFRVAYNELFYIIFLSVIFESFSSAYDSCTLIPCKPLDNNRSHTGQTSLSRPK